MAKLTEYFHFLTRKVAIMLLLGTVLAFLFCGAELAFAWCIQAFLVALEILPQSSSGLPNWFPSSNLPVVLAALVGAGVCRSALLYAQQILQSRILTRFIFEQRKRLVEWAFNSRTVNSGGVMSLFHERINTAGYYVSGLQGYIVQGLICLLLLISLIHLSLFITVCVFVISVIVFLGMRGMDKKLSREAKEVASQVRFINSRVVETIRNLVLIQIYGTQEREKKAVVNALDRCDRFEKFNNSVASLKYVLPQAIGIIVIALVAYLWRQVGGQDSGNLLSYFYLFLRFTQGLAQIAQHHSRLIACRNGFEETLEWWQKARPLLEQNRFPRSPSAAKPFSQPVGWRLSAVNFGYEGAPEKIFENFSLEVKAGESVVIVGESGAGKSTLLGLILGHLNPLGGTIELLSGGETTPLASARPRLLASLGYVGPECYIINGSIRQNLLYGYEGQVDESELRTALEISECKFVYELAQGLDHPLTEQGTGLSAGQKQRLSLARAILRKPKILVLDEATSNLDSKTESRILETLSKFRGKMTMVSVSHRSSFEAIADRVVTMPRTPDI